jgi:hypothetical protein
MENSSFIGINTRLRVTAGTYKCNVPFVERRVGKITEIPASFRKRGILVGDDLECPVDMDVNTAQLSAVPGTVVAPKSNIFTGKGWLSETGEIFCPARDSGVGINDPGKNPGKGLSSDRVQVKNAQNRENT